jgi:hypothetical protein
MAAIEIDEGYWDIADPGFKALAATSLQPLAEVFDNVNNDYASLTGAETSDVETDLGNVDGDADNLTASVAQETDAVHTAGTGDVLAQYGASDALATQAGADVAPVVTGGGSPGDDAPAPAEA